MRILLIALALLVSGCAYLETPATVVVETATVQTEIDKAQNELGGYSSNQEALVALDELQADVLKTMTTGKSITDIFEYQSRAKLIYATLASEVKVRWSELTPDQQSALTVIDARLRTIDAELESVKNNSTIDISLVNSALALIKVYSAIP